MEVIRHPLWALRRPPSTFDLIGLTPGQFRLIRNLVASSTAYDAARASCSDLDAVNLFGAIDDAFDVEATVNP